MGSNDLLAEIVKRYAPTQWENVSTEALAYLLRRPGGEQGLADLLGQLGFAMPPGLHWETQAHDAEDPGIPDLIGTDMDYRPAVIIEVKFWAGLTSNQPTTYLDRQDRAFQADPAGSGTVAFIVPDRRVESITTELEHRARATVDRAVGLPVLSIDGRRRLAVLSWGRVLASLERHLREGEDADGLGALAQLAGMCDRADRDVMMPLALEELGSDRGRRLLEFHELVDKVAQRVVTEGIAEKAGPQAVKSRETYGWRLGLPSGASFRLRVDLKRWSVWGETPVWLRFHRPAPEVRTALRRMEGTGDVVAVRASGSRTYVGLHVPTAATAGEIVDALVDSIRHIATLMPPEAGAGSDDLEDLEDGDEG